jgi:hypothetical protein
MLSEDASFVQGSMVKLLRRLGSDALCRGTCKQPLMQLLRTIYQVPGLLACLHAALGSSQLQDPAAAGTAVGWFVLQVAGGIQGGRTDPDVAQMIAALEQLDGGGASAAQQLRVLLGSAEVAAAAGAGGPDGSAASGSTMLAVADLQVMAGGRHDNDKADFRDIGILPTAEEVGVHELLLLAAWIGRRGWQPVPHRHSRAAGAVGRPSVCCTALQGLPCAARALAHAGTACGMKCACMLQLAGVQHTARPAWPKLLQRLGTDLLPSSLHHASHLQLSRQCSRQPRQLLTRPQAAVRQHPPAPCMPCRH